MCIQHVLCKQIKGKKSLQMFKDGNYVKKETNKNRMILKGGLPWSKSFFFALMQCPNGISNKKFFLDFLSSVRPRKRDEKTADN